MDPARVARIRELAAKWAREDTPALVLLAARRGIVFLHEAWGRLTPGPDSPPLRVDSIFPVSSVSKPIVAACAMILVEDGLIDFNRPVQFYIPEFVGEGKNAVTIHHLLTHTAGLDDRPPPGDTCRGALGAALGAARTLRTTRRTHRGAEHPSV